MSSRFSAPASGVPSRIVGLALAALALATPAPAAPAAPADEPGGALTVPPVLASAAAPLRQALVVEPGAADAAPRTDALRRDAAAYRDLLRLLGFAITTLSPATRPELDAGLRGFARGVQPGADVAILVLGDLRALADGLALLPPGAAPERAEAEGLRLGDALRRAVERGPRALALVVDGCTGTAEACAAALTTLPRGVGAVLQRRDADAPGTLGAALLPAMTVEGRTLPRLRDALDLAGSPDLSDSPDAFAFLPAGFLAGLPLSCNGVDPALPAEALRGRPTLEPLVAACRDAAARYGFSPFFGQRLAAARDQEGARRALASCAEVPAYLADFPSGRYRAAVEAARRSCEASPASPAPVPAPAPPLQPAAPVPTPLQLKAVEAVAAYFHRHDYAQGDSFAALSRLYGPEVEVRGAAMPAAEHMRRMGAWYGGYDSARFRVVPGSLALGDCAREADCRVRGRYRVSALPAGANTFAVRDADFSLKLDLGSGRVLAECGVAEAASAVPCD